MLVSVAMFTFMSTLDSSIVNIALPTISRDLAVPMNKAEWVVSIYLMVVCACLLLFGKVGDSFGKIKVYRIGTIIFTLGSLLCGFNHSLAMLLFGRVIQGIGAFVSLGSIAGPGIGGL
ncbi:MAG: MFS transporter, partial [Enterococcus malodoratus]